MPAYGAKHEPIFNRAQPRTEMEQKTSTTQNGARAKILRSLAEHGMLTTTELAEHAGLTADQVRDNCGAARRDGLVASTRDEVLGKPAYKITAEGRQWVDDNLRIKVTDNSQQSADIAPPIVDPSDDNEQETAKSGIPADSPAGIPEHSAYLVVFDDGGTSPEFFRGVEEAKAAAIRSAQEATVYGLVQIGRTVQQTVFVPAPPTV